MTDQELCKKIDRIIAKCKHIEGVAMSILKNIITNNNYSEKDKLLYKLEYRHRIKGGPSPYLIILSRMRIAYNYEIEVHAGITVAKKK